MSTPASTQTPEQAAILAEFGMLLQEWITYPEGSDAHSIHRAKVYNCCSQAVRPGVTLPELASIGDHYAHLF